MVKEGFKRIIFEGGWHGFDKLDGKKLENGIVLKVCWPDKTVTQEKIKIEKTYGCIGYGTSIYNNRGRGSKIFFE